MGCAKKKMAKGGMVKRRKYAAGGFAVSDDPFFAPDPNMYRNDAKNMANVQAYIKEQGIDLAGGKPTAADVLAKFQAGQMEPEADTATPAQGPVSAPQQPKPPGPALQPPQPQLTPLPNLGINLDNSMGLSTLSATSSGLSGSSPAGISTGLGLDPMQQMNRGGMATQDYRQGGPVSGGPPGVDTVPAMLNNGEYVLPRPTTQAMGGKPVLDEIVLATTGKPPVGYAQGGMPVRSTYDQLRLRGQDLNTAVDRMTAPPPSPQGISGPQYPAQARTRPAPKQSEGVLGGGMPGMERQYGKGGQVEPGNIDLTKRPVVRNQDGSISTVRTMGIEQDGRHINIPTVSPDGRIMSNREAVGLYDEFGKHLGVYDSQESAGAGAQQLHEDQARMYGRGYADGGQPSGWNTDRAAQIENAVNGAMGQPPMQAAPVAPPPAAPEMQLSEGEQYALDSARAAEAAAKPPESKFQTLLRAMTGKPRQYAMGGKVQGYRRGGGPPMTPEDANAPKPTPTPMMASGYGTAPAAPSRPQAGYAPDVTVPATMPPAASASAETAGTPERSQGSIGSRALYAAGKAIAGMFPGETPEEAQDRADRTRKAQPVTPPKTQVVPSKAPTLTPAEQSIMALKPSAKTQDIPVSRPAPASRMRNSSGLTPEAFNQTDGGFLGTVGGAPAGVDDSEYAKMSPAQKSAAKVKSMNEQSAAIRDLRNARREAEGSPPVGGWARYPMDQQQKTNELNQELIGETYKTMLGMKSKEHEAGLSQDKDMLDAITKAVPADDPFAYEIATTTANLYPNESKAQRVARGLAAFRALGSREQLRATAMERLGSGFLGWGAPSEQEILNMETALIQQAMGISPRQPPAPPPK